MHVMHIALGGCIKQPPISFGLTRDTGGHIAYVLGAAAAQAQLPEVTRVDIVTRLFDDPALGRDHALPVQQIGPRTRILRLKGASDAYLARDALQAELPVLTDAFLDLLAGLPDRPDILHCHFADAARLGMAARERFNIPVLYTPHLLAIDKPDLLQTDCSDRLRHENAAIVGADAIIASTRDEAERQIAAHDPGSAGRVWRINPGVSLPAVKADGQVGRLLAAGLDQPELPFILAIARPVKRKNLSGLMQAYLSSPDLQAAANLVILAGQDGPEPEQRAIRADLARMAATLPGKVLLPPDHDNQIVSGLYHRAAAHGGVFVNIALHEPLGRTLIEAARFSLPVVATRNGAPAEIVAAIGHGMLIDPRSPDQIVDACLHLLHDRDTWRQMSRNAAERHRQFDWAAWADRVSMIARRLTSRAAPLRPTALPQTLLAFDIDGTLTGCPRSARAFGRWAAGAIDRRQHVMVATGRSLTEARRVLADWSLPEPAVMITSVGSEIWRAHRRGSLSLCPDYAAWIGQDWDARSVVEVLGDMPVRWQACHDQRRWKISLIGSEAEAWAIQDALFAAGLAARVIPSHGQFIDILPQRAGKASALAFEAARLGLSLADCVAAGDSGNDTCMIAAAGRAIVVGNARAELNVANRPGLYRANAPHAAGVLEGLAHFGLAETSAPQVIPAE